MRDAKPTTGQVLEADSVKECNKCLGCKTMHPLASVIDLNECHISQYKYIKCNCYGILLLEHSFCDFYYGRRSWDFTDGTLVFLTPSQCAEIDLTEADSCLNKGKLLIFHQDLMDISSLGKHFDTDYTFFKYRDNESLHISACEKRKVYECMESIGQELSHDIDKFSKQLIARGIELLLDHCRRFYERQFIMRHDENTAVMRHIDQLIDAAINDSQNESITKQYIAEKCDLSTAYLDDMLVHESGKTATEYVDSRRFEIATEWIMHSSKPMKEIANVLGFSDTTSFARTFKKFLGCTPAEYRMMAN
jgi:AraC-like DNA-binding protein